MNIILQIIDWAIQSTFVFAAVTVFLSGSVKAIRSNAPDRFGRGLERIASVVLKRKERTEPSARKSSRGRTRFRGAGEYSEEIEHWQEERVKSGEWNFSAEFRAMSVFSVRLAWRKVWRYSRQMLRRR